MRIDTPTNTSAGTDTDTETEKESGPAVDGDSAVDIEADSDSNAETETGTVAEIIAEAETAAHIQPKVALIVGASRGIGLAICHRLSDDGFSIVAAGRAEEKLDALREEFESGDRTLITHELDITRHTDIVNLLSRIDKRFGRLDAVINTTDIRYVAPVAEAEIDRCEAVVQVNLMGAFMLSREAVRLMTRQRFGRIVHIGSISGTIGAQYNAIYAASKAGVAGLVKSLALEVATLGITVNAVQPGTVHTEGFAETQAAQADIEGISLEEQTQHLEEDNPQGRLVLPQEVAAAVAFLVGDDASAVNGHLLNVDGGRSIA